MSRLSTTTSCPCFDITLATASPAGPAPTTIIRWFMPIRRASFRGSPTYAKISAEASITKKELSKWLTTGQAWFGHAPGIQEVGEARRRQDLLLQGDLADRLAGPVCLLGDLGRRLVPDFRRERRAHGQALLDAGPAPFGVGLEALHAAKGKVLCRAGQQRDGLQEIVRHDREHDEQLEVARLA